MATVSLKNVKKIYDNKVTAVHDFNLEIADKAPGCRAVLNALYELPELCRRLYSRAPKFKPSDPTPFS